MERKKIAVISLAMLVILLTAVVSGVRAESAEELQAQQRVQIAKARKVLAGTVWTVVTTLQGTKRPETGTETFTFTDRRVTTLNLANLGYAADGSNYSVTCESDGAIIWETMQKDAEGKGEVLLRGDLRGNIMTGVIDIHPARGARKIYYFTSAKAQP